MKFFSHTRIKVTPQIVYQWYLHEVNYEHIPTRPERNFSDGYLSFKAITRLKERINFLAYIAKTKSLRKSIHLPMTNYKLVMIVLTLSSAQIHSDKKIKERMLQPFLRILRNRYKVINYVWKAEAQENGNIHFHITIDKYIYWQEIRDTWNNLQETLGYITRSNSQNPNSIDVHAVYKKRNIAAYISGEMAKKDLYKKKGDQHEWKEHYYWELLHITGCDMKTRMEVGIKRPIEGKIYDCNQELKKIKPVYAESYELDAEVVDWRSNGGKFIDMDFCKMTFIDDIGREEFYWLRGLMDAFIIAAYEHPKSKVKVDRKKFSKAFIVDVPSK